MSEARADELNRRIERAAFNDGQQLRDLRDSLPREDLSAKEREELAGKCEMYLTDMSQNGFEGVPT